MPRLSHNNYISKSPKIPSSLLTLTIRGISRPKPSTTNYEQSLCHLSFLYSISSAEMLRRDAEDPYGV